MRNRANPLTGATTTRKRRNTAPQMNGNADSTVIRYKALGSTTIAYSTAGAADFRAYIPGFNARLAGTAGVDVVSFYATGVFRPGTMLKWEPTTSPTKGGRVFLGFTDNPEIIATIGGLWQTYAQSGASGDYAPFANAVKGLGSVVSFPAWQEYEVAVPSKLRRKRFDTNRTIVLTDSNIIDRCCQVAMFMCADGYDSLTAGQGVGGLWYHDVVDCEGLHSNAT